MPPQSPTLKFNILVVDDDTTSLTSISTILTRWNYKVFSVSCCNEAMEIIKSEDIDLVMTDLHLPGMIMNGLQFQEHITSNYNLPVIIMSSDDDPNTMVQCLLNGAVFFISKPVSEIDLKNIWQFTICWKRNEEERFIEKIESIQMPKSLAKRNKEVVEKDENPAPQKKNKVMWTKHLHEVFMQAIRHLTLERAVPKAIHAVMNVPGLTRAHVASHLQKYRMFLKKEAEKALTGEALNTSIFQLPYIYTQEPYSSSFKELIQNTRNQSHIISDTNGNSAFTPSPLLQYGSNAQDVRAANTSLLCNNMPMVTPRVWNPNYGVQTNNVVNSTGQASFSNASYNQIGNNWNAMMGTQLNQASVGGHALNVGSNQQQFNQPSNRYLVSNTNTNTNTNLQFQFHQPQVGQNSSKSSSNPSTSTSQPSSNHQANEPSLEQLLELEDIIEPEFEDDVPNATSNDSDDCYRPLMDLVYGNGAAPPHNKDQIGQGNAGNSGIEIQAWDDETILSLLMDG